MKTTRPLFRTFLLLTLLVVAGGTFFSCEKPEEQEQEQSRTPAASVTTSDVDIQGTWNCIYPVPTDEESYLHVTFFEHYYTAYCEGPYYVQRYYSPQWPSGGYFMLRFNANYLIHSGKFYLWHNVSEELFTEIPYRSNIPPTFDVSLNEDTLNLYCIYTRENCPDLDLPEETYYTFVKLN